MDRVKDYLRNHRIVFTETPDGDLFFKGKDGRPMFVRAHSDGTYDWSVNESENLTNLLDYRVPMKRSEVDVLNRIDEFWTGTGPGPLMLDTLGMVERAMALGLTREQAEHTVAVAREAIHGMHKSGMDATEIKARFAEQLRDDSVLQAHPNDERLKS